MIQLKDLALFRGSLPLITNTSVQLHQGWKIALIGENGCGKSSLFALLRGVHHQDGGDLSMPSGWRIAHMSQEVEALDRAALDYVIDGFEEYRNLEREIQQAESSNNHTLLSLLHSRFDAIDGYAIPNRAEQLLSGLGFLPEQFQQSVSQFSGGWRIRLNLARTLLLPSDLMLLDEPTNHLDLETCVWLEKWLNAYEGTLVFVSHDRDFIDNVSDHILSFESKNLMLYRGNYLTYETTKSQRLSQQQAAFEKQQVRITEINQFVTRFKAKATKAKQAQSRLKELERMAKISPAHIDSPFTFRFQENLKVSDPLISLHKASLGYKEQPILQDIECRLSPGDRIGLLGVNGAGKSTFIKSLFGDLSPVAGHIHRGQNLNIGYFAQHQLEALDVDASPLLTMKREAPGEHEQNLKNFLGSFGFQGDQVDAPIKRFSGGEKARLCLAIIAWHKPNLLLLDEPTNHLDLEIRHSLTLALQAYQGALVVVSHDRHLLRNTVDQFWLIDDGQVSEFDGDLEAYRTWTRESSGGIERPPAVVDRKEQKRIQAHNRQKLSPIKKQIQKLEAAVDQAHLELKSIEARLADSQIYEAEFKAELQQCLEQQAKLKQVLERDEAQWMELLDELEQLEAQLL